MHQLLLAILIALVSDQAVSGADPIDAEARVAVCSGCHGARGHSLVADNPILAGQPADYLKAALNGYLDGSRDYGIMKTFAGRLRGDDFDVISRYYARQPAAQSQISTRTGDPERGAGKVAVCVACHGTDGRSVLPLYPNLAGQHARYLRTALRAYKNGTRSNPVMRPMAATLNEQDIADIAAFYASRPVANQETAAKSGGKAQ